MIPEKMCILFAGAVGSSKTPIAMYLSGMLDLSIFNNDAIRTEVIEDLGRFDSEEHLKRRNERLQGVLGRGFSFIVDASIDREWGTLQEWLPKYGYSFFIISLDLSKEKLIQLYEAKGYTESLQTIDRFIADHEAFLKQYGNVVGLRITDENFSRRLELSYQAVCGKFLK